MTTQILAKFENSLRTFRPNERFSQCIRHGASPVIATHPFPFPFPFLVLPGACFALVSSPTVYFACNCCCSCCFVCPVSCFFWHIKCSVLSDEMRLLGGGLHDWAGCAGGWQGGVQWGSGWVACPPLYAHKNKFQDFIMPMYLSLSMCAQWTVLSALARHAGGITCNCKGRLHLLFEFLFVFVPDLCLIFCKCSIE